jgi:hypothetical protein
VRLGSPLPAPCCHMPRRTGVGPGVPCPPRGNADRTGTGWEDAWRSHSAWIFPPTRPVYPSSVTCLAEVMRVAGVTDECIDELSVAVTEACGNVLRHSADSGTATYAVRARLAHHAVSLEVVDTGPGFDPAAIARAPRDAG